MRISNSALCNWNSCKMSRNAKIIGLKVGGHLYACAVVQEFTLMQADDVSKMNFQMQAQVQRVRACGLSVLEENYRRNENWEFLLEPTGSINWEGLP
jgi:hypothetical protein